MNCICILIGIWRISSKAPELVFAITIKKDSVLEASKLQEKVNASTIYIKTRHSIDLLMGSKRSNFDQEM